MIRHLCIAFLFLFLSGPGAFSQKKNILAPGEFEQQINKGGIQILDVRTSQEYFGGHIKNSLQADWLNRKQFNERVQHIDKTKPLFVYCGSGVRSNDAAKWLRDEGFQWVFELQNGFIAWKNNNRPIESDTAIKQMSMADYQSLLNTSSLLLIDFGAKWCPPCKKMESVLQELQTEFQGKFELIKIDAGIHTDIMQQLRVEKIPSYILYKDGKAIWRKDGLVSLEEFRSLIQ